MLAIGSRLVSPSAVHCERSAFSICCASADDDAEGEGEVEGSWPYTAIMCVGEIASAVTRSAAPFEDACCMSDSTKFPNTAFAVHRQRSPRTL